MHLTTTRTAIHDALAWGYLQRGQGSLVEFITYLTRIEKTIRSCEPCGDFLEAGYICAAINLCGLAGGWLKFAYGPDDDLTLQTVLATHLRDQLRPTNHKKNQRCLSLAMTGLEDYRLRVWQEIERPNSDTARRQISVQLYAERMGVDFDPTNWSRDWQKKLDLCNATIQGWDRQGVGYVSCMVRSLRGNSDMRPSEVLREFCPI